MIRDDVFEVAEGDHSDEWCPDDPDYQWARAESDAIDAEVDRRREEKRFGS